VQYLCVEASYFIAFLHPFFEVFPSLPQSVCKTDRKKISICISALSQVSKDVFGLSFWLSEMQRYCNIFSFYLSLWELFYENTAYTFFFQHPLTALQHKLFTPLPSFSLRLYRHYIANLSLSYPAQGNKGETQRRGRTCDCPMLCGATPHKPPPAPCRCSSVILQRIKSDTEQIQEISIYLLGISITFM